MTIECFQGISLFNLRVIYTHKECGVTVTDGRQGIRQGYTSTNSEFISLVPPPHMVAPSRELANLQHSPFSQPANNPLNNNYSNQDTSLQWKSTNSHREVVSQT